MFFEGFPYYLLSEATPPTLFLRFSVLLVLRVTCVAAMSELIAKHRKVIAKHRKSRGSVAQKHWKPLVLFVILRRFLYYECSPPNNRSKIATMVEIALGMRLCGSKPLLCLAMRLFFKKCERLVLSENDFYLLWDGTLQDRMTLHHFKFVLEVEPHWKPLVL